MKPIHTKFYQIAGASIAMAFVCALPSNCFSGEKQKWKELPKSVQDTVVANGGKAGQDVDKESETKNGKAVYEAGVKDKDGSIADLVITEDGKLIETKHDDAADAAQEKADRAKQVAGKMKFSHSRDITNPFLPLASLKQDVLEGSEDGKKVRIERTPKPDVKKTFKIGKQDVEAFVVEDREWEDGKLAEVVLDYFAQDDGGTVYYLGEDVDEYADGKIVGHDGSWLLGKDTKNAGVIIPGHPRIGDKFKSEDVSKEISESDEVISLSEDAVTPAGTYTDCIKVKETLGDGGVEYKYYARNVGVVREVPSVGDVRLKSHTAK